MAKTVDLELTGFEPCFGYSHSSHLSSDENERIFINKGKRVSTCIIQYFFPSSPWGKVNTQKYNINYILGERKPRARERERENQSLIIMKFRERKKRERKRESDRQTDRQRQGQREKRRQTH